MSEESLPHTHVRLWVSGKSLRAALENVVLAEYLPLVRIISLTPHPHLIS
jgi:hypothetical protein